MALIVNVDRAEYLDVGHLSSVYEVGSATEPMQWLMHLLSSAENAQWPLGGHWLGNRIWVCKEDDFCAKMRQNLLALKPELEHPAMGSSQISAFQLVELTCKKINDAFKH